MTVTFKQFVDRYTLDEETIEALWLHLLMHRLVHWRDGLKMALAEQGHKGA